MAALIERRIGFVPGLITKEAQDTGSLNQSKRASGSPGNLLINGRSSVHAGSGGTLSTIDVCNTPSGKGCKTVVYTNVAKSSDAAQTAGTVTVNGNPACTQDSIFAKSSGDEAGRCGGVSSGTIKGKADVVTAAGNVLIEGKGALRQFDLMVSNNQNTPPAPVMQGGGARPDFLDTVGAKDQAATPPPWRFDWHVAGGLVKQLNGRWVLQSDAAHTDLNTVPIGGRDEDKGTSWTTTLEAPAEGSYDYALRLPDTRPQADAEPHYDIPFRHYTGANVTLSQSRSAEAGVIQNEIAVPVVIGLYADPERNPQNLALPELGPGELSDKARAASPLNQGWLYIYVDGFLWRELEVRGGTIDAKSNLRGQYSYVDVNLTQHLGNDIRPATIQLVNQLLLPHKVAGQQVKVEIAYSRVQWSWTRLVSYGGIHPEDPRGENDTETPVSLPQNQWGEAAQRRARRMQSVDLSGYSANWPTKAGSKTRTGIASVDSLLDTAAEEFLTAHQGQGLPMLLLDDPLGWAEGKAYAYQSAWRKMEDYIADLSNPDHDEEKKKEFPFAPWFDSAVLANQYFFVEKPNLEADGLQKQPAHPPKKSLKKAMKQRAEWRNRLNLGDIQIALGTQHRAVLREKIKTTKQALVAVLDRTNPELDRLVATLDDWFELPGEPKGPLMVPAFDNAPDYGDAFIAMDELIARLGDHEYKLDNHLETEPQSEAQLYALEQNDLGAKLLNDLLSPGHPLYARLAPAAGECGPDDEAGSGEAPQLAQSDPQDPAFNADKLLTISRRSAQALSGWIEHYASVAAGQDEIQKSIARFISKHPLMPELEKVSVPLGDFMLGQAPEGYDYLRVATLEADNKIKRSEAIKFDGGEIKLSPNQAANVALHTPDGQPFAFTTLEAFKQSKGFSSRYWKRLRHGTKHWYQHTVEVWMVKSVKGAPALARNLVDMGVWTKGILPIVVVFEGWNLQGAVRALGSAYKNGQDTTRFWVNFAGAVADTAAIAASVNQARLDLAHREAEKLAGESLERSRPHTRAIRWARNLGTGAGAFSAGLSIYDMLRNANEGDDAAIAHGVMASGFILVTASELIGLATVSGLSTGVIGLLAGPIGWVGLAVVLAGAALLSWVFTEDTPLEEWLANGPFSQKNKPHLTRAPARHPQPGQEYERYVAPDGSQLLLREEQRILRIGSVNDCFSQGADGAIYMEQEDGSHKYIGKIGEPLDLSLVVDTSNRYAGFDEEDEVDGKFHVWKVKPISAYQSLLSAIYTPTATLELRRERIDQDWRVELSVHIPQYIDNASLLMIEMWQTRASSEYEQVYEKMHLIVPEAGGSGPRSVMLVQPLFDQVNGKVKAKLTLDLDGTGEIVLPLSEPSWSKEDEARRQQLLTQERVAPVGEVVVAGEGEEEQSAKRAQVPKLDKAKPLELTAGPPPSDYEPEDGYNLAP
ncbi:MAG: DUF4150 domain-containing protein [Candidatus Thiodiazotropha sp. (ex Monitilora ramsayi)]|nr:DUF4150 domain-containing protein [Candidatus Thiodiazotropha sp. (ex Monitilora ramsayi)]